MSQQMYCREDSCVYVCVYVRERERETVFGSILRVVVLVDVVSLVWFLCS